MPIQYAVDQLTHRRKITNEGKTQDKKTSKLHNDDDDFDFLG